MKFLFFVSTGLFSFALFIGCFNKQEHQITAPEIPHYVLSGKVVDADDKTLRLPQVHVHFQAAFQLYECDQKAFSDTTDEGGEFRFASVCPGFYSIQLAVNNIFIQEQRFELKHGDTTLVLSAPKIINAELSFSRPQITGVFWRTLDSLAFLSTWSPLNSDGIYKRIYHGTLHSGFRAIAPFPLVTEYPELSGLVQIDSLFYSFSGGLAGPTIYEMSSATGKIVNRFKAPHRLTDIAFDDEFLWGASTRQSFIKWRLKNSVPVEEFSAPGNHPRGIAWDNKNVWSSDEGEFDFPRIFKHGPNMEPVLTFCPVYVSPDGTSHLLLPEYLSFSADGLLWCVASTSDGNKGLYKFTFN